MNYFLCHFRISLYQIQNFFFVFFVPVFAILFDLIRVININLNVISAISANFSAIGANFDVIGVNLNAIGASFGIITVSNTIVK